MRPKKEELRLYLPALILSLIPMAAMPAASIAETDAQMSSRFRGASVRAAAPCILELVRKQMRIKRPPKAPAPKVQLAHEITLHEFQNAVEAQWLFRPDTVLNVYVADSNRIFLISDKNAYRDGRSVYDSLAHEFVHYFQVKALDIRLEDATEEEEYEATLIQTEFRQTWGNRVQNGEFICPINEPARP
ncbi:MAG: hypothetical protein A2X94_13810 [Bdellovibrionales bacterium GWB1_55_8]|nr:MAG: hypothetical protein A2X94_13810 [Bdellovibrionales bacterium GWB1_55_8]